ncbi:MAG: M23 family metallopeptidase, partial [Muribaculaceae bacterium]|nr:M23 family metallopeptidase [Muribaculaceae bacterium]
KVYATGAGKVVSAGWNSGYGNCVEIDHGYNYLTRYAHLSRINVTPGQQVKRGDKIGEVGNTGKSTGPHLHYEVRYKGYPQNPINYYFLDITPDQYGELIRQAENAGHVMD